MPLPSLAPHIAARLWSRISKTDTCWTWRGRTLLFWDGARLWPVRRLLWLLTHPDAKTHDRRGVYNWCGSASCVRPHRDHNAPGTKQQAARVARLARGSAVGTSKLTERRVRAIRRDIDAGKSNAAIAVARGCSPENVRQIRAGETWSHLS